MENERLNKLLRNAAAYFRDGRSPFSPNELAKQNVTANERYELGQEIAEAVEFVNPPKYGKRFREVLAGVPPLSPDESVRLMKIALGLIARELAEEDPATRGHLHRFERALIMVCMYSATHQEAVRAALENSIKKEKKG